MLVLDRIKWINHFIINSVKGVDVNDHLERYDIVIVNKDNSFDFIRHLKDDGYLIKKEILENEFYKKITSDSTWWNVYDLFPDLYIDFDSLNLYSKYGYITKCVSLS